MVVTSYGIANYEVTMTKDIKVYAGHVAGYEYHRNLYSDCLADKQPKWLEPRGFTSRACACFCKCSETTSALRKRHLYPAELVVGRC